MIRASTILGTLTRAGMRLRVVGLAFIVLAFILFIVYSTKQHKEIIVQDSIIVTQDSVITHIEDSAKEAMSEHDRISAIVANYIRLRNEHKADSMELFYADTLISYFKNIRNAPRKKATASDRRYWRKYSQDEYIITEPVQIIVDDSSHKAILTGRYCQQVNKCKETIIEIAFNSKRKIESVKAYYGR